MTAGLVAFVGNKVMSLHHGAKLQAMKRFALNRRDRALRFALFSRAALGELPRGYLFEIRFDFEHFLLLILTLELAI